MFSEVTSIIENGLKSMDGSTFQKLSFDFLNFKGYTFIGAPGAVIGKNKTSRGTPDGFFQKNDGKFIFCEVTTQNRDNNVNEFLKKLSNDIEHCFNESKSKISNSDISEIILIFNSEILPNEVKDLKDLVREFNSETELTIFNIQNLSAELQYFPNVGSYIPNVPNMDGIYSIDSFINNSKKGIRPDLKNYFYKDDDLFKEAIKKLSNNDYLILYGVQGVGKTRLAIEVAKEFSEIFEYRIIVIKRYSSNLIMNIRKIINGEDNFLFIIDDYTDDFSNLSDFLEDLENMHAENKFKFIFSLRNQFLDMFYQNLRNFTVESIKLYNYPDLFMRNLIENILKQKKIRFNQILIDQLVIVSKGNPALCLMALIPLIENNDISHINNPKLIYQNYFNDYDKLRTIFSNKELLKILGVFSFFDVIEKNNSITITLINELFDYRITEDNCLNRLIETNLIFELDNKYYFEDSILSTYIFYLSFIENDFFDFEKIAENFIKNNPDKLKSKIWDVLSIFGINEFKQKYLTSLNNVERNLDGEYKISFYEIFYMINEDKALLFITDYYNNIEKEDYDFSEFQIPDMRMYYSTNRMINLLFMLKQHEFILKFSLKLISNHPSLTHDILINIEKNYSFNRYSIEHEQFYYQNLLMDVIENNDLKDVNPIVVDYLFIFIIKNLRYLVWHHHEDKPTKRGMTIFNFNVVYTDELMRLRSRLLSYLFKMYGNYPEFVNSTLKSYIRLIYKDVEKIIQEEIPLIYGFLQTLDYTHYVPNKLAFKYYSALKKYSIDNDEDFKFIDWGMIKKIDLCSNALDKYKKFDNSMVYQQFGENLDRFSPNDLIKLMDEIKNNEDNVLLYANELFCFLISKDLREFKNSFNYYKNNKFKLFNRPYFIRKLFNCPISSLEIYHILNEKSPIEKDRFNGEFFLEIPEEEINSELFVKFIEYLNQFKEGNYIFYDLDGYFKYNKYFVKLKNNMNLPTSNIIQYMTKLLIEKSENCLIKFNYSFCELYNEYFKDNFELLKEFYFNYKTLDSHYDYNFKELSVLCTINKCFLKEYLEWGLTNDDNLKNECLDLDIDEYEHSRNENYKLTFIWELEYTYEELEYVISYFINNQYFSGIRIFFSKTGIKECEFIKEFISKNHENKIFMRKIFNVINKYYTIEEYMSFLKLFLELNQNIEIFEYILNPDMNIRPILSESNFINSKLKFYIAIKQEIGTEERYLNHAILLQELIDEYEMK